MPLVKDVLSSKHVPEEARQAALDRTHLSPGVPKKEGSTTSFWLQEPHHIIATAQSKTLPDKTDITILGSGVTALSTAWTILQTSKQQGVVPPSIVILEARDACSGATGRNGGHILETALEYLDLKKVVGIEAAMKLTKFRLAHLSEIDQLVANRPEVCKTSQFRKIEFVSVYFDEESFCSALENLDEFKKDMPEESKGFLSYTREVLRKKFQLSQHAIGAITGPAGAVWPYRLVTSLLEELKRNFPSSFSIETNTPANELRYVRENELDEFSFPYSIITPRGTLQTRQVIHCTNAHVGYLVPGFRGRVSPLRGQMTAQGSGHLFKNQAGKHSWLLNYQEGFDYLTQLPPSTDGTHSDGEMMLGGGLAATRGYGVEEIGVSTDDKINLYADIHLSGALPAVFGREHWGTSSGVKNMWTGTMGFSSDGFPWVGKLPGSLTGRPIEKEISAAEWAAVGYSGEGMVHAWLSGKAIGIMVLVQERKLPETALIDMQDWLPDQLRISEARIKHAVLPKKISKL